MVLTPLRVIGAVLPVIAMAGLGVGLFFVIQTRGDDGASRVAGSPTEMATFAAPTETPELATPTAEAATPTEPPPTEPAATEMATSVPTLPPPPPRPDEPAVASETMEGGQWYRLAGCFDFYLPAGWTFEFSTVIADPGGGVIGFLEQNSRSFISFFRDNLEEVGRRVLDEALGPPFDQIAATLQSVC